MLKLREAVVTGPQSPEKQHSRSRKQEAPSIRRKLRDAVLTTVLLGGVAVSVNADTKPTFNSSASSFQATEGDFTLAGVEQQFGIKIVTMEDAYNRMGLKFDRNDPKIVGKNPDVAWTRQQLNTFSSTLEGLPKEMYEGETFFLADFGTDFAPAGVYYNGHKMIGFQYECINPDSGGTRSLVVHEIMHSYDDAKKQVLWGKVDAILGDKSYLKLKDFDFKDVDFDNLFKTHIIGSDNVGYTNIFAINGALATLKSFAPDQSFGEGIAGLAQVYAAGKENFYLSIGPLLDGNGYDGFDKNQLASKNLEEVFPKTHALYELYKQEVFQGKEYSGVGLDFSDIDKVKALNQKYGVDIFGSLEFVAPTGDLDKLDLVLSKLPPSFLKGQSNRPLEVGVSDRYLAIVSPDLIQFTPAILYSYENDLDTRLFVVKQCVSSKIYTSSTGIDNAVKGILGDDFLNQDNSKIKHGEVDKEVVKYLESSFMLPAGVKNDWKNVAVNLAVVYFQGWDTFKQIMPFTDPGVSLSASDADLQKTKAWQLYQLIKQNIYGGWEKPVSS